MPKFIFVFRGGAAETPGMSPAEMQAHVRKWYDWADKLATKGCDPKGQPLDRTGRTIRGVDRVVTDGPYAEMKDLVTGSMSVVAGSLDDAVALAHDCPVFELGGSVEVRPATDYNV